MKYSILALISALLALCTYIYPMEGDDFIYSFTLSATNDRVVDLAGVLEGTANCFHYINGRTLVNFLIFLFVNLIPQWGMFLLAFLTFFLTLTLLTPNHAPAQSSAAFRNAVSRSETYRSAASRSEMFRSAAYRSETFRIISVSFLFLLFCPDIYDTLMWKTGFMNYALPGMLNLLFLHHLHSAAQSSDAFRNAVFRRSSDRFVTQCIVASAFRNKVFRRSPDRFVTQCIVASAFRVLLPIGAFLTASLHEGISLPISGGLIIYLILNFRNLTTKQYAAIIPYLLGTLLILLTPGTTARVGLTSSHTFHLLPFLQGLLHSIPSLITTLLLFLLLWHNRKHTHPILYFLQNTVTLSAILISLLLFLLLSITTGIPEPRYFYFTHILSLSLLSSAAFRRSPDRFVTQCIVASALRNKVFRRSPDRFVTQCFVASALRNAVFRRSPDRFVTKCFVASALRNAVFRRSPNRFVTKCFVASAYRNKMFRSFSVSLLLLTISFLLFQTYQKRTIAEKEFHLFATTTDYVVPSDFTDLTSDTTLYSNQLIAKYFNKPYLIAYPSPIYYHLYLHEDAPQSSFSPEWLQLTPSLFARKLTPSPSSVAHSNEEFRSAASRRLQPSRNAVYRSVAHRRSPDRFVTKCIVASASRNEVYRSATSRSASVSSLTLTYTLPLLNTIQRHTQVTPQLIRSKRGTLYQVVSTHSSFSKITNIE